jgi:hypothetical protein
MTTSTPANNDHLQALAQALEALAEGGSWALARIVVDLGLKGEGSVSEIAARTGLPIPTCSVAIRIGSRGRYLRSKNPAQPGKVVKPKLPGVFTLKRAALHNTLLVSLGPTGKTLLEALQGRFQDDT